MEAIIIPQKDIRLREKKGLYPYRTELTENEMPFDMRFDIPGCNSELCHATGLMLVTGPKISDQWIEYQDSQGGLHYGR